jgi:hypothetical protein
MSTWLFSEMCTFCRMISGHICDVQATVQRNVHVLSQDPCQNTDGAVRRKISKNLTRQPLYMTCGLLHVLAELSFIIKLIHGPLRISCHMWKWVEMGEFFGKMDLLLCWDEMSQQSWTKNHRQNVTDFGTKYYSETVCHTVTNRRNVTI